MTGQTKKDYLTRIRERYFKIEKKREKSVLISEVMANLHLHRKSVLRALHTTPRVRSISRRGKQPIYGFDLVPGLKRVWEVAGFPCSKRLEPQLGELLDKLLEFKEIKLYGNQEELLRRMKSSTIDKLLEAERDISKKEYGLSGTKKSPLLKTLIPIRTYFNAEETKTPGHTEMDCVLHCGESLSGIYAETLNVLDIATHWNEKKIFLKKTKAKIVGAFHEMKTRQFPFPIVSIDFDNGPEFVNWSLQGYCTREEIAFTRSRSYHKNDQAHIEGKNYQSIRKVVGYDRITDPEIVRLIDDIYQNEHRLVTNFFYTTMKLKTKEKIEGHSKKTHEKAKTPYQRVLESDRIAKEIKDTLQAQYKLLNPAELQRNLKKKLDKVYRLMKQKHIYNSVTVSNHATSHSTNPLSNT